MARIELAPRDGGIPEPRVVVRKVEPARHHADDRVGRAIDDVADERRVAGEGDGATNDAWIAAEVSVPRDVAQEDDVRARLFFVLREPAAERRLHAEHGQ